MDKIRGISKEDWIEDNNNVENENDDDDADNYESDY